MQRNKIGTVTLVGAGCGKDLITVKGLNALKAAEVVVYDDLIDKSLLAGLNAEIIYVGKRSGKHSKIQAEINKIIIDKANEGKNVVRLKGGDSFVFGRGGEEILALRGTGIPYDTVPGVTSAVAVPEELGIPVTHRYASQSFTVVTGHTASDKEESYEALAKLNGTLVFLMGLKNIASICQRLIEYGKDRHTPASVLSNGFSAEQTRINGVLENIAEKAKSAKAPAVLVIGDTAAYDFEKTVPSVSVIGTSAFCKKFSERYGNIYSYPIVEIIPQEFHIDYNEYEQIAFLSSNAVETFFSRIDDIREIAHLQFACIGSETAKKLSQYKIRADFIPGRFDKETLLSEMPERRTLVLGNDNIYKTVLKPTKIKVSTEYIVFASAAGVKAFFESGNTLGSAKPVCIGKATATELSDYTNDYLTAEKHTVDGIVEVIKNDAFQKIEKQ